MRLILTILLIGLFKADAQIVINASAPYRPLVSGNLLLDNYPNAEAAYSLRKLRTAYTGAAIRVRKDTTGQPEQDINFTESGNLDTASLKSFLNARSGFVTTWYDQSGQGRNASQSTQANQPRIANLGVIYRLNNKLSIQFGISGVNLFLDHSVVATSPTILNIFSSFEATAGPGIVWSHRDETTRLIQLTAQSTSETRFQLRTSTSSLVEINVTGVSGFKLASALLNVTANSHSLNINSTNTSTNTTAFGGNFNSATERIGATRTSTVNPSSGLAGGISEIIIYTTNQSSNRTLIESNINSYYAIY